MTTVLADAKRGVLVTDSNMCEGDRVWTVRKAVRARGILMAGAGTVSEYRPVIEWFRINGLDHPEETPPPIGASSCVLVLATSGLWIYDESMPVPQRVAAGIEAIGSGAVAALSAYEGLGFQNPSKAVRIACKHDAGSRGPVRVYRLNNSKGP